MVSVKKVEDEITLSFDRGTLVLRCSPIMFANLKELHDLFLWDERVHAYRGMASAYTAAEAALKNEKHCVNTVAFRGGKTGHWTKIPLRPYQMSALVAWESQASRGIVALPTGAGKTRIAMAAMAASNQSALCIVPTRILLEQWVKEIRAFYSGPVGVLGDGQKTLERITVATFESAYRQMPRLGHRFDLLIVDEVHHFGGGVRDEALAMSIAAKRLGLTATKPEDSGQLSKLCELVGPVVFEKGIRDLAGRYLSEFEIITVSVHLNPVEKLKYDREARVFKSFYRAFCARNPRSEWRDFTKFASMSSEGKLALAAFFRSRRIVSLTEAKWLALTQILHRHRKQKTLIFTAETGAAYKLSKTLMIPSITGDIGRAERSEILENFASGNVRALVSCKVLNEGLDVPDSEIAIIVGGSSSGREHVQRIGRILRPVPGKKALVYELVAKGTHEENHSRQRGKPFAQ